MGAAVQFWPKRAECAGGHPSASRQITSLTSLSETGLTLMLACAVDVPSEQGARIGDP
jgi:hypothetical protein